MDFIGKFITLVHALMVSKHKNHMKKYFISILKNYANFHTNLLLILKKSLNNALSTAVALSHLGGCNFHFWQIIWKNIQKYGLTNIYKEKCARRKIKKMLNFNIFSRGRNRWIVKKKFDSAKQI